MTQIEEETELSDSYTVENVDSNQSTEEEKNKSKGLGSKHFEAILGDESS